MTNQEKLILFVSLVGKEYSTKYKWEEQKGSWYVWSYHYNSSNLKRAAQGINFLPAELDKYSELAINSLAAQFILAMTKQVKVLYK